MTQERLAHIYIHVLSDSADAAAIIIYRKTRFVFLTYKQHTPEIYYIRRYYIHAYIYIRRVVTRRVIYRRVNNNGGERNKKEKQIIIIIPSLRDVVSYTIL